MEEKNPNAGNTAFNVANGGNTFFGGAPSILTAAAAMPISNNFIAAIPAIECPIINGFSGKLSINRKMLSTTSINPVLVSAG
ncbi:hypothetical protein D3C85_1418840 [compost metagenome]